MNSKNIQPNKQFNPEEHNLYMNPQAFIDDLELHMNFQQEKLVDILIETGIHEESDIELLKIKEETQWTLERYFRYKLVCNKFDQQCRFVKNKNENA